MTQQEWEEMIKTFLRDPMAQGTYFTMDEFVGFMHRRRLVPQRLTVRAYLDFYCMRQGRGHWVRRLTPKSACNPNLKPKLKNKELQGELI